MTLYTNSKPNVSQDRIRLYPAQMETQSFGRLRARCTTIGVLPIDNATVSIISPNNPQQVYDQLTTDANGLTQVIELPAPSIDYSMEPSDVQPYSEYTVQIFAPGYEKVTISNIDILPDVLSEQPVILTPQPEAQQGLGELFVVPPHTLFGDFPPKIPESEIKPASETGAIVLSQVVIPEFIIVHDGPPADPSAENYYVRFRDYIKNVASSEIYATWSESTIYANVLAILSFTLNRVYTEWYPSQGYNFTITSSTAYDHKWVPGRNIFDNIGVIVDSVFVNYLSRPGVQQPILTQYCDGNRTQCPGWMTQWGSKYLGDQGLSAIEILRNFYGDTIYINTAPEVSGVPSSWPGYDLVIGTTGNDVRTIQTQLNRISDAYPAIPKVAVDGVYGQNTANAVEAFQRIFSLPVTGVVNRATWYKISFIYVAVARLAQ